MEHITQHVKFKKIMNYYVNKKKTIRFVFFNKVNFYLNERQSKMV